MYSVVCNEKEGMRKLVHWLAEKGCRKPAYLYDFLTYSGRHKLDGFYQGCRELDTRAYRTRASAKSSGLSRRRKPASTASSHRSANSTPF